MTFHYWNHHSFSIAKLNYKRSATKIQHIQITISKTEWVYELRFFYVERGSSVSIVYDYGLDDRGSIPVGGRGFSSTPCAQTGSGAHPASYPVGTGGPFPGGKARPGRDADHSPPSSAEVKDE
jgi:hypothetical protein